MAFLKPLLCVYLLVLPLWGTDELRIEMEQDNGDDVTIDITGEDHPDMKSEWGAAFMSMAVPGTGHLYVEDHRRAALYFAVEAVVLTGMIYSRRTSNRTMDNAFALAEREAGTKADFDRDNNYWLYMSIFESSDDYNIALEQGRSFDRKITDPDHEWRWSSRANQERYTDLRDSADQWEDAWALFLGGMALNRLIAFIDSRISARNYNTQRFSQLQIHPTYSVTHNETGIRGTFLF
ncbi:hypothetical protein [Chitinivibrio alkaliphilus]|uniref:DUF5683 domain-containing protein n=1 Tax=Chitinivibrio alkaliphilus ACht1 TaxID=1313304 RepID=U7D6H6_9BACT|nr:hypothetical protein [Chitinivibrio alkaliphilus]ERP31538.1 hypothetical protein CALK_1583 [Chitinivibrio alkaliphilus ACht1]